MSKTRLSHAAAAATLAAQHRGGRGVAFYSRIRLHFRRGYLVGMPKVVFHLIHEARGFHRHGLTVDELLLAVECLRDQYAEVEPLPVFVAARVRPRIRAALRLLERIGLVVACDDGVARHWRTA